MGGQSPKTVMVVEDYDDARAMLRAALERQGYSVLEAANGREAVEIATSARPDLILMDLDLPIQDGIWATSRIRKDAALARIPIIAITAYPISFSRVKAFAEGCSEYMQKPLNLTDLKDALERLMRGS